MKRQPPLMKNLLLAGLLFAALPTTAAATAAKVTPPAPATAAPKPVSPAPATTATPPAKPSPPVPAPKDMAQISSALEDTVVSSPGGKVQIAFRFLEKVNLGDSGMPGSPTYIRYQLAFRDGKGRVLGQADYADVYGFSPSAEPTPYSDIARKMKWNSREDVVILPEEDWERPEAQPVRRAVNLNPKGKWRVDTLQFEFQDWADSYNLVGEKAMECGHNVVAWNGKAGQLRLLMEAKRQVQYGIKEMHPGYLMVESQLTDCPNPGDEKTFKPGCFRIDFQSWKSSPARCPQSK